MNALYDTIGINYANLRIPDPRIAAHISKALGSAQLVVNVGAGAGSYEPEGLEVTAVEPSAEMIKQRPEGSAACIQASAEDLPFEDNSFDAAMASLTIHHWKDKAQGVAEMRRVAREKIVFFTYDASFRDFWLFDYFPQLITVDEGHMPELSDYEKWLGPVEISTVPIPHDCIDGFLGAYWRRPAAYLDERVRAAMSSFCLIGEVPAGLEKLSADLKSGAWENRYGALLKRAVHDSGYRLVQTI